MLAAYLVGIFSGIAIGCLVSLLIVNVLELRDYKGK